MVEKKINLNKNRIVINLASPSVEVESTEESLLEVARVTDWFAQKFAKGAGAALDKHKAIS